MTNELQPYGGGDYTRKHDPSERKAYLTRLRIKQAEEYKHILHEYKRATWEEITQQVIARGGTPMCRLYPKE